MTTTIAPLTKKLMMMMMAVVAAVGFVMNMLALAGYSAIDASAQFQAPTQTTPSTTFEDLIAMTDNATAVNNTSTTNIATTNATATNATSTNATATNNATAAAAAAANSTTTTPIDEGNEAAKNITRRLELAAQDPTYNRFENFYAACHSSVTTYGLQGIPSPEDCLMSLAQTEDHYCTIEAFDVEKCRLVEELSSDYTSLYIDARVANVFREE